MIVRSRDHGPSAPE